MHEIDGLRLELLPACEGKQALGQCRATFGSLDRIVEQPKVLLLGRDAFAQKAEAAKRCHQQIVEIMGDPTSELSDCIQLLGLEELRHRLLALPGTKLDPVFEFLVEGL